MRGDKASLTTDCECKTNTIALLAELSRSPRTPVIQHSAVAHPRRIQCTAFDDEGETLAGPLHGYATGSAYLVADVVSEMVICTFFLNYTKRSRSVFQKEFLL